MGAAQYPVPSGAFFVSGSGSDTASGSEQAPFRTVGHAISAVPTGATVVLRGGAYHESVSVPSTKRLTVQAYPGEAVWFDGSVPVSTWYPSGALWASDGWTARFDNSPTYTSGAADSTTASWGFVNSSYPMAAHPDEMFVDGVQLRQVGSLSQVTAGAFFVDTATSRLYLGSDPTGHAVRSSDLTTALTVRGAGSVVRGIGVRRYATSVPLMGTVRLLAPSVSLENVVVADNATQGVFIGSTPNGGLNNTLTHVTAEHNGLMGIAACYADGLRAVGVRSVGNNSEHFNSSPAAGGFKVTRSRGVSVRDSVISGNDGTGLWFDESVYDVKATGNDIVANTANGVSFEISSKAVFADNLIAGSGSTGLKINNGSGVSIWNNTIVGSKGRPVWLVQDSRVASNLSTPGHDPRQSLPDPTVTWLLGPVTVRNNIIAQGGASCLLCGQDTALLRSGNTIGISADGDVYGRSSTSSPSYVATWPNGTTSTSTYATLSGFRTATGREAHGVEFTGSSVLDGSFQPTATLLAVVATTAQPLDSTIATLTGRTSGELHLGAWLG